MFLGIILSYLIGSIPFGLLFSAFFNQIDIRQFGSGNIGATNVFRTGGKNLALLTFLGDFFKGLIPVYFGIIMYSLTTGAIWGFASIIGHMFPIWLRGVGGKGISTRLGVYTALNLFFGAILIGVWSITFGITRYASLASLLTVIVALCLTWSFFPFKVVIITYVIEALIIMKHRPNVENLLSNREKKLHFGP